MKDFKNKQQKISVWYSRWLAMCYADTIKEGLSVLNKEDGYWYIKQYNHFMETVYPKWIIEEKSIKNYETDDKEIL